MAANKTNNYRISLRKTGCGGLLKTFSHPAGKGECLGLKSYWP